MGFTEAIKTCFQKYVSFSGRASRPEYWWFLLFVIGGAFVLSVVDAAIFGYDPITGEARNPLGALFHLAVLLPLLAVAWRRLHDSGRPGWYVLLPMLFTMLMVMGVFAGVFVFGGLEQQGADRDALRGLAALLGTAGLAAFLVIQIVLLILMIWWLTRPSDAASNLYGPPPSP